MIFEFPVGSKFGRCILYITNFGVSIESERIGMILNLHFDDVASLLPLSKHSARLAWQENDSTFEFVVHSPKAADLCAKYKEAHDGYLALQQSLGMEQQGTQSITVTNPLELVLHDTA